MEVLLDVWRGVKSMHKEMTVLADNYNKKKYETVQNIARDLRRQAKHIINYIDENRKKSEYPKSLGKVKLLLEGTILARGVIRNLELIENRFEKQAVADYIKAITRLLSKVDNVIPSEIKKVASATR